MSSTSSQTFDLGVTFIYGMLSVYDFLDTRTEKGLLHCGGHEEVKEES